MYTLLRTLPIRRLLIEQAPVFLIAFLVAEFFYKFRSFALECIAFLITWFILDVIVQLLYRWLVPARAETLAQSQIQK